MKIVNRVEFLKLPSGTLFREYEPCTFGDLRIKGGTRRHSFLQRDATICADDFDVMHLDFIDAPSGDEAIDIMYRAVEAAESFKLDYDGWMRDGWSPEYNKQLYAVYDETDAKQLIEALQRLCGKQSEKT